MKNNVMICNMLSKEQIGNLITYCQDKFELYNKIANMLHDNYGITGSLINLLVTYAVNEITKEVK